MPNRKNQPWPVSPALVIATVAVCGFVVASAVGYTLHRNRNEDLRRLIVAEQIELRRLSLTNELIVAQVNNLRSKDRLMQQMQRFGLTLLEPRHEQYLPLTDPVKPTAPTDVAVRLAGQPRSP